ncbi:MAG TPA: carboxypeptidase M32, partial [Leptospiraceae bacterium]|nr:carboxypeptidase M32 [Leptospiraceae bacterium]
MKENSLSEYRKYWKELNHFRNILGLLHWDMEVNLPEKASEERSEQISLLASQSHEMLVGKKLSDLISDLEVQLNTYSLPEKDILSVKREIEILKKDIDREKKLPLDLVKEFSRVTSLGQSVWANARKKSSFSDFAPVLNEIVKL